MSTKNTLILIAVGLCAIVAAGGILAQNMAFKVNYPLTATKVGVSKDGTNSLALPYFRQTGVDTAFDLIKDIEGGGPPFSKVFSVSRFLTATDSLAVYTGRMGTPAPDFALVAGEGYRVQMTGLVNYIVVGTHDPSLAVTLKAAGGGSKSGTNDYAAPYNITAVDSLQLFQDIEGRTSGFTKVFTVAKFLTVSSSLQVYTARMGSPGAKFNLTPGESYRIQMLVTVPYILHSAHS